MIIFSKISIDCTLQSYALLGEENAEKYLTDEGSPAR